MSSSCCPFKQRKRGDDSDIEYVVLSSSHPDYQDGDVPRFATLKSARDFEAQWGGRARSRRKLPA